MRSNLRKLYYYQIHICNILIIVNINLSNIYKLPFTIMNFLKYFVDNNN